MEPSESPPKPVTEDEAVKTAGRYQIQEELGRGAAGTVFKAYDQLIGRTVALKAISVDRNTPHCEQLIERLKLEAKAAGKLDHPNIITIYDVVQEDDVIYLSMQFIEGKTLLTFLSEDRVPSLGNLMGWADQILSAVGFAHAHGVIHRDLKPANLMLTGQGTIKILDFGIAKVGNETLTQAGMVVGTPSYMAPEQVAGKKIDHRADIFALGSVFYELATGEKPFRGDVTTILYKIVHDDPVPPSIINPSLPGSIDAIIRKALAKDPKERFQSCDAMRSAFLEQAALLRIKPASSFITAAPVAAPAPRADNFPHYLLEEIAPQRRKTNGRIMAGIFILALIATAWAFYTRSQTGSFPPLMKKLEAAAARIRASRPFKSAGSDQSAPQQSPATVNNGSGHDSLVEHSPAAATGSSAPATSEQSPPPPDASALSAASQLPAAGQGSNKQPVSGGISADSIATSSTPAPGLTGVQPSSTSDRSLPQPTAPGQQDENSGLSPDNTSASGSQAVDENTAEVSDSSGNAKPSPAIKPVKKTTPEAALNVDGFTRKDVPELVRQADAAEERGDYRLARYQYQLILKLDPRNSAARAGLYRINATNPSQ